MEDDAKRKLMIGVGAAILTIAIILIVRTIFKHTSAPSVAITPDVTAPEAEPIEAPAEQVEPAPQNQKKIGTVLAVDTLELQLKRITMDFVSRFGTFSTDGHGENLKQLFPLMGPAERKWAEVQIMASSKDAPFQSFTTRALSAKIVSQTESTAVVRVNVQREIKSGTKAADRKIMYDTANVSLIRSGSHWLINELVWTGKQ